MHLFLLVESSSKISEVIAHLNSLFVPSRFDFSWKFSNFINSLLTNLIHALKNSRLVEISSLKFMFKKTYLSVLGGFQQMGSKFKLDCVKSKNSYILLVDVINFKLRSINYYLVI